MATMKLRELVAELGSLTELQDDPVAILTDGHWYPEIDIIVANVGDSINVNLVLTLKGSE